jgi:FeS assembly SUF system regulator
MLRITKLTDYGIELLVRMAREDSLLSATDLSKQSELPLPVVGKVLKILAREKLLKSQRGAGGGYLLSRDAEEISLVEIINALEGTTGLTDCNRNGNGNGSHETCSRAEICCVADHWSLINKAIFSTLDGISLADMASGTVNLGQRLAAVSSAEGLGKG